MRACASLVTVGSFFISSRYSSSVPRHCLDSRAARSFLITCSKLLTSAIGKLLVGRAIRFVGSFQESEALTLWGRWVVLFSERIPAWSIMIRARVKQYGLFANYRDYPQIFSRFERLLRL